MHSFSGQAHCIAPPKALSRALLRTAIAVSQWFLGRRQVVRHRFLVSTFPGSNPGAPAIGKSFIGKSFLHYVYLKSDYEGGLLGLDTP